MNKKRVLIFIISYNHEDFLVDVLKKIPVELKEDKQASYEILVVEDCSKDNTFQVGYDFIKKHSEFPTTILSNPINLGFGGNQKLGYQYAIENDFDHVALIHGDGQYAPELIPELIKPLLDSEADAVFGSRMINSKNALRGGMPLYKWIGNKVLTGIENFLMSANLTEWHCGLRLYSVAALRQIPFYHNSDYYDFDTHIIIQLLAMKLRIKEIAIPTFYGEEVSNVNGYKYAWKIVFSCLLFHCQKLGIFYHPRFYAIADNAVSSSRMNFTSADSKVLDAVSEKPGSILLYSCDNDSVGERIPTLVKILEEKGCQVTLADWHGNSSLLASEGEQYDYVVLLDILEMMSHPENFIDSLRESPRTENATCLVSGANLGFFLIRLKLLFGKFNYGMRGILDFRHQRLFTYKSAKRFLFQAGLKLIACEGLPAPYPVAFGSNRVSSFLVKINSVLASILPGLFGYQFFFVLRFTPTTAKLLKSAKSYTSSRIEELES